MDDFPLLPQNLPSYFRRVWWLPPSHHPGRTTLVYCLPRAQTRAFGPDALYNQGLLAQGFPPTSSPPGSGRSQLCVCWPPRTRKPHCEVLCTQALRDQMLNYGLLTMLSRILSVMCARLLRDSSSVNIKSILLGTRANIPTTSTIQICSSRETERESTLST